MNVEVQMTLDEAVAEVLGTLTGLDLTYEAENDRYRAITRQLNRALRGNALENEWSFYASTTSIGPVGSCSDQVMLPASLRPRIINDDAVRFNDEQGVTVLWAYFLPRDALHKYQSRSGLWCSVERQTLKFSRPFSEAESTLEVIVPVMREPKMFRLPETGTTVPRAIRKQLVDFSYPDLIVARAAWGYAQTDPVMQPRVQTLEQEYKNIMYQLVERDTQSTDSPYINETIVPVQSGLRDYDHLHLHPHANHETPPYTYQ